MNQIRTSKGLPGLPEETTVGLQGGERVKVEILRSRASADYHTGVGTPADTAESTVSAGEQEQASEQCSSVASASVPACRVLP